MRVVVPITKLLPTVQVLLADTLRSVLQLSKLSFPGRSVKLGEVIHASYLVYPRYTFFVQMEGVWLVHVRARALALQYMRIRGWVVM